MVNKITGSRKLPFGKRIPALVLVVTMLCSTLSANVSLASPAVSGKTTKEVVITAPDQGNSYTLSLNRLGAANALNLVGQDSRNFIDFNVRSNEVISKATLKILYKYSPDLLSELSQINVYLNGESISTIEVSK